MELIYSHSFIGFITTPRFTVPLHNLNCRLYHYIYIYVCVLTELKTSKNVLGYVERTDQLLFKTMYPKVY